MSKVISNDKLILQFFEVLVRNVEKKGGDKKLISSDELKSVLNSYMNRKKMNQIADVLKKHGLIHFSKRGNNKYYFGVTKEGWKRYHLYKEQAS